MLIMPSLDTKWLNLEGNNVFVRKSASCYCVEIGINFRTPFWTFSQTKWQSISRCLVLSWNTGLEAMCIALCESQYRAGSLAQATFKSFNKYIIHWSSKVALESALYSASDEDQEIVCYFLALHEIKDRPKKKQNPVVDLLESTQHAQSAST
jgi:hypothetical protein